MNLFKRLSMSEHVETTVEATSFPFWLYTLSLNWLFISAVKISFILYTQNVPQVVSTVSKPNSFKC